MIQPDRRTLRSRHISDAEWPEKATRVEYFNEDWGVKNALVFAHLQGGEEVTPTYSAEKIEAAWYAAIRELAESQPEPCRCGGGDSHCNQCGGWG
jgi:hypothetical protein